MKRIIEVLTICILLYSCSMNEIPEKLIPKEADKFATDYIKKLTKGDIDYCIERLVEEYQTEDAKNLYVQSYDNLKSKELISSRLIALNSRTVYSGNAFTIYHLSYEYEYSYGLWVYYTFQILEEKNYFEVQKFNIQPNDHSVSLDYKFTFRNKTIVHFVWLGLSIIVPIFILVTLGFAIMTPIKKKWLWLIFILFGFVSFSLDWTTGTYAISPINFKLLGAGIVKSGIIAPWILSFSIPLGALIFWFKRDQVLKELKILEERKNKNANSEEKGTWTESATFESKHIKEWS